MNDPLILRSGSSELRLLPHLGGAIGGFTVGGRAILRPTPDDAASPLDTASFPLVPYPNRIADGRFSFGGKDYALPLNVAGFEHPLHGQGWLKRWTVRSSTQARALLSCVHEADAHWPWDWSALQHFELEDSVLRVRLEVTNQSAQDMPCGLGQHPYFVRGEEDALAFTASGTWLNDDRMIPVEMASADTFGAFAQGVVPYADVLIDNCWFGWAGRASWGNVEVRSDAGFLHVFAPPGERFLCLEPTSQMPDSANRQQFSDSGFASLAPGATQSLSMKIRATL